MQKQIGRAPTTRVLSTKAKNVRRRQQRALEKHQREVEAASLAIEAAAEPPTPGATDETIGVAPVDRPAPPDPALDPAAEPEPQAYICQRCKGSITFVLSRCGNCGSALDWHGIYATG